MAWGAIALLAVVAIAVAPGRKCWSPRCHIEFAEPRPSDLAFGEFGLTAKRGRILAADGTPLAYTVRAWRFYLDPCAADLSVYDAESFTDIFDTQPVAGAFLQTDELTILIEWIDSSGVNHFEKSETLLLPDFKAYLPFFGRKQQTGLYGVVELVSQDDTDLGIGQREVCGQMNFSRKCYVLLFGGSHFVGYDCVDDMIAALDLFVF